MAVRGGITRIGAERRPGRSFIALVFCLLAVASPRPAPGLQSEQEIAVEASRQGFRPGSLRLRRGESYRLRLTTADREHCFGVEELRIEKRIRPGQTTEVLLNPTAGGRFRIYCCVETGEAAKREAGELVVLD